MLSEMILSKLASYPYRICSGLTAALFIVLLAASCSKGPAVAGGDDEEEEEKSEDSSASYYEVKAEPEMTPEEEAEFVKNLLVPKKSPAGFGYVKASSVEEYAIQPGYALANYFSEGRALIGLEAENGFTFGYIDEEGEVAISPTYEEGTDFKNGVARVKRGGKFGLIDRDDNVVVDLIYDSVGQTVDPDTGMVPVSVADSYGYVDVDGDNDVSPTFDYAAPFSEGLAVIGVKGEDGQMKFGFINEEGKPEITPAYEFVSNFREGLAIFQKDGKMGVIDRDENVKVEPKYKKISEFSEGLAVVVTEEDKVGAIDRDDNLVIPAEYQVLRSFSDGLALFSKDGQNFGYLDKENQVVIDPKFPEREAETVEAFGGEMLMPGSFQEGLVDVRIGKSVTFIDKEEDYPFSKFMDGATPFNKGISLVDLSKVDEQTSFGVERLPMDKEGKILGYTDAEIIAAMTDGGEG